MTVAELNERGARVIERRTGPVVVTCLGHNLKVCGGCNTERFRRAVYPWLDTPEGLAWRADHQVGGAS